jgi:hypothetical protein
MLMGVPLVVTASKSANVINLRHLIPLSKTLAKGLGSKGIGQVVCVSTALPDSVDEISASRQYCSDAIGARSTSNMKERVAMAVICIAPANPTTSPTLCCPRHPTPATTSPVRRCA